MAYYRVELELMRRSNASGFRTSKVTGVTLEMPMPGAEFSLVSKALDPDKVFRVVSTSPVKSILFQDTLAVEFTTVSGSEYRLTVLDTMPEAHEVIQPKAQA